MEGITQVTTGNLPSLSEQELLDCNTNDQKGCNGGRMDRAFQFIEQNGGLTTEANYPYNGVQGTCNSDKVAYNTILITGYEDGPANDENALLNAVANQPVSVAIDSTGFQHYSSGVFTSECGTNLNHAVTVIGYGTSDEGIKYWLVKNSWGTNWGDNGYMKIKGDVDAKEGLCGIAMQASYPTASN